MGDGRVPEAVGALGETPHAHACAHTAQTHGLRGPALHAERSTRRAGRAFLCEAGTPPPPPPFREAKSDRVLGPVTLSARPTDGSLGWRWLSAPWEADVPGLETWWVTASARACPAEPATARSDDSFTAGGGRYPRALKTSRRTVIEGHSPACEGQATDGFTGFGRHGRPATPTGSRRPCVRAPAWGPTRQHRGRCSAVTGPRASGCCGRPGRRAMAQTGPICLSARSR